ncbi:hypothetical protein ABZ690_17265 [Streptomyces sp. NPDC006967]|uniref:hypothetical protein n=1 Tax=Streptomyces sp. NPDC006967 TaxID=3156906 RepID=UPI0033C091EA
MGHEVAGVEGLHSHVALAMEQEIADSLQSRWLHRSWSAREGTGKAPSPTALPFDLEKWWKPASFMPFVIYRILLGILRAEPVRGRNRRLKPGRTGSAI